VSADQADQARITNTAVPRRQHDLRLKSRFDAIFNKYGHDFSGIGDVIDITSGNILVDNGHVSRMRHARDIGVEVIRTQPAAISAGKRRKTVGHVEDTAQTQRHGALQEEDHDELTSPARPSEQDAAQGGRNNEGNDEESESMILAEQYESTSRDLGGTPQPRQNSPTADVATRVLEHVLPKGQQVNLNDPAQLALYTQNLVQEILRQTGKSSPHPTLLPTPPASARSAPIKPFRSIWGGEDRYHSEDEDEDEPEDVDAEGAMEIPPLQETTRRARHTWQSDEVAKLLQLRDVDGLSWSGIAEILGRPPSSGKKKYAALKKGRHQTVEKSLSTKRAVDYGRRATFAASGIDSIRTSRSIQGEPSTRPERRTRQSLPAIPVIVPHLQETQLRSLRPRRTLGGNALIQSLVGVSATVAAQASDEKVNSPEIVNTPAENRSPEIPVQHNEKRRRRGRPSKQEPKLATDEEQHLKKASGATVADKEHIKFGERRRRRRGGHDNPEPQLVTDEKQQRKEIPDPTIVVKERSEPGKWTHRRPGRPRRQEPQLDINVPEQQDDTTTAPAIETSATIVQPEIGKQASPPSARSRLRRVSQRLSQVAATANAPAPQYPAMRSTASESPTTLLDLTDGSAPVPPATLTASILPPSPAASIDVAASILPQGVEVSASERIPQRTARSISTPGARKTENGTRRVSNGPLSIPHNPSNVARLKSARAKRMSGGDVRRVSGVLSATPRRIVSNATSATLMMGTAGSATPMTGTGTLSTAVRRHVVPQDDLGSEDELDQ